MYTSLISASALNDNLAHGQWVIVDCRFSLADTNWGRDEYSQAHIPGAFYAHLDEDLSGPILPGQTGRHPLPTVEAAAALFSSWGINEGTQVVAYDDKKGAIASRLWWMLRWLGHTSVAVLDGGWTVWKTSGYALSKAQPVKTPGHFQARPQDHLMIEALEVNKIREDANYKLIDSRAAARYRGEEEPIDPVAGHIPGAVNAPFAENISEEGVLLSKEKLQDRFREILQQTPVEQTVFYCGSGVTACHNLLALYHAGLGEAKLYPGSWSHWITTGYPVK